MSPEFLEHIFEPFAQENIDAQSVYHGTGLGLAIVKSLVDKMNGTIEVTSEKNAGINSMHLLLAEDNDLNAEIATTLLNDEGANVTLASDGEQAVKIFTKSPAHTFDAILMDVMMPKLNGLEATRAIRNLNRPDAKEIPIIAMTANAFDEDSRACLEAGMNAHLPKPFQIEDVVNTLAKYTKSRNS